MRRFGSRGHLRRSFLADLVEEPAESFELGFRQHGSQNLLPDPRALRARKPEPPLSFRGFPRKLSQPEPQPNLHPDRVQLAEDPAPGRRLAPPVQQPHQAKLSPGPAPAQPRGSGTELLGSPSDPAAGLLRFDSARPHQPGKPAPAAPCLVRIRSGLSSGTGDPPTPIASRTSANATTSQLPQVGSLPERLAP